jgi:hypothetical protein
MGAAGCWAWAEAARASSATEAERKKRFMANQYMPFCEKARGWRVEAAVWFRTIHLNLC